MTCRPCALPAGVPVQGHRRWWPIPLAVAAVLALAAMTVTPWVGRSSQPDVEEQAALDDLAEPSYLNQEVLDSGLGYTVSQARCGDARLEGVADDRIAQGRWCYVTFTIRNVSREPRPFIAFAQRLADDESRRFRVDPSATAAHRSNQGREVLFATINPGNVLDAVLVYDVPARVEPTEVQLHMAPVGGSSPRILLELPPR